MSCLIEKGDKIILECSVGLLEDILYEFQNIILEDKLGTTTGIDTFIEKLEQCILTNGGIVIDIAQLFSISSDVEFLLNLLKRSIELIEPGLRPHAVMEMRKLYEGFGSYRDELIAQGK